MTTNDLRAKIRYLREVERLSTRQIAEKLGISRGRCLRALSERTGGDRVPRESMLDPYRSLVGEWYSVHPTLTASQVYERLRARNVQTSYTTVKRLTRAFRVKRTRCYWPMTFAPGEEAQVDWFIVNHPVLGKLAGFAFISSFSRLFYARVFPRMSFEFFIEGHLNAFGFMGGIPRALRYDNLKSVVLRRHPLTYNAAFLEFAHHYHFEIRLCNVRAGNEKGRVERAIRTIRESFLNTADHHQSLPALNAALGEWLRVKNTAVHRATGKTPLELSAQEALRPLPVNPWLNRSILPPKLPTKTGLILFDSNKYSVPEYLVGAYLHLHVFCEKLEIYDSSGSCVATHPRSFERNKLFINPLHRSFARISITTKAERICTVIANLDPCVRRFMELSGEDRFQTAYGIFALLRAHPRAVVISTVREALARNMFRLQFVQSLLGADPLPTHEDVSPANKNLLSIGYKPRSLEEYSS